VLIGLSMKVTEPASINHRDPQLSDTPTCCEANEPLAPCRISSKYRRLVLAGALFHAQRGIAIPSGQDSQRWSETRQIYPIIYLDALVVKVRDGHQVRNKAAHIAVGVDLDGVKHVLGIWIQAVEGAKFWAGVCAELANRGIRDVLIVCCDGLTGFPEAVEATWPQTTVQTCVVHLIRAAMRFVSHDDRKKVAAALRPIYTAATVEAAETELIGFAGQEVPGHRGGVGERLAAVHSIPGLPARSPADHLHHG
jgi:hypothetical protein